MASARTRPAPSAKAASGKKPKAKATATLKGASTKKLKTAAVSGAKSKTALAAKPRTKAKAATGTKAPLKKASVLACYKMLVAAHPDAHCELDHQNAFELICATALSAQSTDVQVNKVTPGLFQRYPTPEKLARAKQEDVESCLNRLGMFRQKAKNLIGLAQALVRDHKGEVPPVLDELVKLPGVGRKTANVVLGVAFEAPVGVVVDTHVQRITQRLGWTAHDDVAKIERDLMTLLPRSEWDRVSHTLIFHGRRICDARKPACSTCPVNKKCAHAFDAVDIGRKPKRTR